MTDSLKQAARIMRESKNMVCFSGAGMSTESGIPDFRSPGGVWSKHQPVYFNEFMSSAQARQRYWRFYLDFFTAFDHAAPNPGHRTLGRLFAAGRLSGVVTQNIDGLHQAGGVDPDRVVEIHGNAFITQCLDCGVHDEPTAGVLERFRRGEEEPACPRCNGRLKPKTISFGQSLDMADLARAEEMCGRADLLLVVGSSLVVTPAAELPWSTLSRGGKLVILNREPTPMDDRAHVVVREPAAGALERLAQAVLA